MERDGGAAYVDGVLIVAEREQRHVAHRRRVDREKRIARAQAMRLLERLEPALRLAADRQRIALARMGEREARIELDRPGQVHQGRLRLAPSRMREAEHQV